jgi:hypothetical protein
MQRYALHTHEQTGDSLVLDFFLLQHKPAQDFYGFKAKIESSLPWNKRHLGAAGIYLSLSGETQKRKKDENCDLPIHLSKKLGGQFSKSKSSLHFPFLAFYG